MKGHRIANIIPGSIAEEMEIAPGDLLLSVNGFSLKDVFDYHYLVNDENITVLIEKQNGEQWELEIEKEYNEDLGLVFEQALLDEYHSCRNKCIFCFIDQMPPGMRETLYFKDDDSRLSFLQGNYVTLTNMSREDLERIKRFHLAPINVSVHTTNPELRCRMLNNRFAGEALDKMKNLAQAGIEMNSQVVLCKGWNDGEELDRTIEDLGKLYPAMESLSIVPMGMTKYREGLVHVDPFTKKDAVRLLEQIGIWQDKFLEQFGTRFVHASDEWFLMADRDIPEEDYYEGYGQLENGVGMVRSFLDEWRQAFEQWKSSPQKKVPQETYTVSCVTGRLFGKILQQCACEVEREIPNIHLQVFPIRNDFFGEEITVAGLVTGTDILKQLSGKQLGDYLMIPDVMLRSGEEVFLDDYTVSQVAQSLQIDVVIVKSDGKSFFQGIFKKTK
jgi:putative radical SAM enzyme (TIGR03279 family)